MLARFRRRPTVGLRNQLVERYREMVASMARAMAQRLPASVDVGDLTHAGIWGLMQALAAYRPERGSSFVTFMRARVRGAMIDELRNMDYLPRLFRRRLRLRNDAVARLRQQLQREPSDVEIAAELGLTETGYRLRFGAVVGRGRWDSRPAPAGDEVAGGLEALADLDGDDPVESVDRRDLIRKIEASLEPIEWRVLRMHYLDGLSGKEVARRLRLSPARICQIHLRVLDRLKAKLRSSH